jgi:hypothetical protein
MGSGAADESEVSARAARDSLGVRAIVRAASQKFHFLIF